MSDMLCPYCNRPLTEIDYYGEPLIGCIDCNRWVGLATRRSL
ncbi:MAG: hypothetical protein ACRD3W_26760 [Terriglobales bacterium]